MENHSHLQEISISYRPRKLFNCKITGSSDVETIARKIYQINRLQISLKEYFVVILVNYSNEVIGYFKLSEGGLTGTVADLRLVFSTALKTLATGIILVHNHPSGGLRASEQDVKLTNKFREAAELLDIQIIDHIILTITDYYSFADNGV